MDIKKFLIFCYKISFIFHQIIELKYFYIFFWILSHIAFIFFYVQALISYIIFVVIICLINIHIYVGMEDIFKDYIFNNFLKKFYSVILVLLVWFI